MEACFGRQVGVDDAFYIALEEEDTEPGVEPKFKIRGLDHQDSPYWVDSQLGGRSHLVQCEITQVCHGTLAPDGPPASLIVLLFAFQPFATKGRFKWVEVHMTLHPEEGSANKPHIITIAPENQFLVYPSRSSVEISHEISASSDIGLSIATAGLGFHWGSTKSMDEENSARVTGKTMIDRKELVDLDNHTRKNKVVWAMTENTDTKSGVPTLMQTALLVKRGEPGDTRDKGMFSAKLTIKGELNMNAELIEKGKMLIGHGEKSSRKVFSLGDSRKGDIKEKCELESVDLKRYQRLLTKKFWTEEKTDESEPSRPDPFAREGTATASKNMFSEDISPENRVSVLNPKLNKTHTEQQPPSVGVGLDVPTSSVPLLEGTVLGQHLTGSVKNDEEASIKKLGYSVQDSILEQGTLEGLEKRLGSVREEIHVTKKLLRLMEEERLIMKQIAELQNVS